MDTLRRLACSATARGASTRGGGSDRLIGVLLVKPQSSQEIRLPPISHGIENTMTLFQAGTYFKSLPGLSPQGLLGQFPGLAISCVAKVAAEEEVCREAKEKGKPGYVWASTGSSSRWLV